jgi:hypothetical protein
MARRELTRQDKMRRLGISLLIVACLGGIVLAGSQVRRIDPEGNEVAEEQDLAEVDVTGDDDLIAQQPPGAADPGVSREEVVEQTFPAEGAQVLQQQQIGIDLGGTYRVSRLVVDRRPIPEDELIRRDELGQVFFQPGEGLVIETFPPGRVCAVAEVIDAATGEQVRSVEWCFEVV